MEQRRLRLGDILDDYCPRERRVTNHAVVAMIEEDVKQTRCTTCDAEHPYKGGREPRRRKKDAPAALYREVLADMPEAPPQVASSPGQSPGVNAKREADDEAVDAEPTAEPTPEAETVEQDARVADEGPINRPLIRATLPRQDGQKEARPLPEFTVRHNGGRGSFRGDRNQRPHGGGGNGGRPHGRRFSGGHQGQGAGHGPGRRGGGFGGGHPQHRHGGKKRSR